MQFLQRDQEKKHINVKTELTLKMANLQSEISKKDDEMNTYRSEKIKESEIIKQSLEKKDKEHNDLKTQFQKTVMEKLNKENEQTIKMEKFKQDFSIKLNKIENENVILKEKYTELEDK